MDIGLAEIAHVQDKANVFVPIPARFFQHELELRHIHDAAGVFLVEQRFPVPGIVSDGHIEYRQAFVILGMAVFHKTDIAGLAILVSGIV